MNGKKAAEEFGKISGRYIEEALMPTRSELGHERRIIMSKKKIFAISLAAALVVAVGGATIAASVSNLSRIGEQYKHEEEALRVPEELKKVDIVAEGTELVTTAAEDSDPEPLKPGEARFTSVVATKYSIDATVEINVAGMGFPDEMPEDALKPEEGYWIERAYVYNEETAKLDNGLHYGIGNGEVVSIEDDILTAVVNCFAASTDRPFEGDLTFTLKNIGYTVLDGIDKTHKPIYDGELTLTLSADDYKIIPSRYSEPVEHNGVVYTLEASPSALVLTKDDGDTWNGWGDDDEEIYLDVLGEVTLNMKDGTSYTTNLKSRSYKDSIIISSGGGGYGRFSSLIDVNELESVTIQGVVFNFN